MSKWRMAGQLAVAVREAEKIAEQKRMQEEQMMESVRRGQKMRKLARQRGVVHSKAKIPFIKDEKMKVVLVDETEKSKWDLTVARSEHYKRLDQKNSQHLMGRVYCKEGAMEEGRALRDHVEELGRKEKELDKEIYGSRNKLRDLNHRLSSAYVIAPDKVVRRQEIASQRLGKQLEINRQLKEEICTLEIQRGQVRTLLLNLEQDCERLSKLVHDYSEVTKTTYEDGDKIHMNINKVKDHLDRSVLSHEGDMQLLQFNIDVLKRTEKFLTCKNKFRQDDSRDRLRVRRDQLSVTERDSQVFGSLLDTIRIELEQGDVETIIVTFIQLQEENYMLFQNISGTRENCNEMMMEIESVKEEIASLRKGKHHSEQEAFAHKLELMDKIETCKKGADEKEDFITKADHVIATYINGIVTMLQKLGYTEEHIQKLTGVFNCVEERNIHEFLAELENHVNLMYDLKTLSEFLAYDQAHKSGRMPPPPDPLPARISVQTRMVVVPPPEVSENQEEDESFSLPTEAEFRPLSFHEIFHYVGEDLETRQRQDELGAPIPSPTMTDPTSEAIGDNPRSPCPRLSAIDIF